MDVPKVVRHVLLVVVVFVLAGVSTDRWITAHEVARGMAEVNVRMGAAMAGLFAGGVLACLAGIAPFLTRGRKPQD